MNSIKYYSLLLCIGLLLFSSCKKDEEKNTPKITKFKNGILVLNEGLFQHNNSTLSWINSSNNEVKNNVFLDQNDRPLGDTGNDMVIYGNKVYIAITGSSTIEVLDKNSLESLKQIPFNYDGKSQEPRQIASHKNNIYVTSFDGYVSKIDTTALKVTQRIKAGRNPEGICVQNDAIYVANSGGLDFENPDTTVFKIDVSSFAVVDTFVVGKNPGDMIADDFNNVYVVKRGDYSGNPSELVKINVNNGEVTNTGVLATSLSIRDNKIYISYFDHSTSSSHISVFDCGSQTLIQDNLINTQEITTLYGVIPFKEDQLIAIDAMNFTNTGYLKLYHEDGSHIRDLQVGLNPNTIISYE